MLTLLYLVLSSNLQPMEKINIPELFLAPIVAGDENQIWVGGYYSSKIVCLNKNFKPIYTIDYGNGEGPGEFKNPRAILPFEKDLIVVCRFGKTLSFNKSNGHFQKNIIRYNPFAGCLKFNENSFIMLWGKNSNSLGNNSFSVYDTKGDLIEAWEVKQPNWKDNLSFESSRGYAISPYGEIFIAVGGKTNLLVYKNKNQTQGTWNLKPPSGFVPAPKDDISPSKLVNPESVNDFMNSFTMIYQIFTLAGKELVVSWKNPAPIGWTMDIYESKTKKPIFMNIKVSGPVVGTAGKNIFVQEPLVNEEFETILQRFEWK